ncbi:hypothetical protein [Nostoc sp. CHAB 5715]|uniref:hypothetical protein n=1 Tax=Nostoc sp. CHAB 5715 TaxID=2780400 RepID=UPI001E3E3BB6|nr:hypothetical protein [Nostoc sp. CHAB 5715]MCC5620266.1 hypothetical protein [Nostoc sp. CHAB 5715]
MTKIFGWDWGMRANDDRKLAYKFTDDKDIWLGLGDEGDEGVGGAGEAGENN